jgi:hypothetical protein
MIQLELIIARSKGYDLSLVRIRMKLDLIGLYLKESDTERKKGM